MSNCVFCGIRDVIYAENKGSDENSTSQKPEYLFADDQLFVIKDIKPQAPYHYLVITREHIESAKNLTKQHIPLVKRMVEVGAQVLKENYKDGEMDMNEIKLGFHWPPMTWVKHLHLHVFYPHSQMSFMSRNILFRSGLFFVTPDSLIERLQTIDDQ